MPHHQLPKSCYVAAVQEEEAEVQTLARANPRPHIPLAVHAFPITQATTNKRGDVSMGAEAQDDTLV
jgi:hypothetical protein